MTIRRAFIRVSAIAALVLVGWVNGPTPAAQEKAESRVTESGTGDGIADRALTGKGESFPEGGSVYFLTKIEGGQPGAEIEHVWIRDGKEVFKKSLAVGGSPWRTWSTKTMHKGSAGHWKVEARTADGKVLAEAAFTCTAAP